MIKHDEIRLTKTVVNRSALELTMQGQGIDGALAAAKELAEEQCDQKSDPPNYSVAGESTLGLLSSGGNL